MLWYLLSIAVLASSPLGRALMDRIAGRHQEPGNDLDEIAWMESRFEDRIADLEDRLDFAQRMLEDPDNQTRVTP